MRPEYQKICNCGYNFETGKIEQPAIILPKLSRIWVLRITFILVGIFVIFVGLVGLAAEQCCGPDNGAAPYVSIIIGVMVIIASIILIKHKKE